MNNKIMEPRTTDPSPWLVAADSGVYGGASRDLPTYVVGPDSFETLNQSKSLYICRGRGSVRQTDMSNVQDVVNNINQ
jgi:hypothetical protein